jgi:hypothetical protein
MVRLVEIGPEHLVVQSPRSGRRHGISFDFGPEAEHVSVTELETHEPPSTGGTGDRASRERDLGDGA